MNSRAGPETRPAGHSDSESSQSLSPPTGWPPARRRPGPARARGPPSHPRRCSTWTDPCRGSDGDGFATLLACHGSRRRVGVARTRTWKQVVRLRVRLAGILMAPVSHHPQDLMRICSGSSTTSILPGLPRDCTRRRPGGPVRCTVCPGISESVRNLSVNAGQENHRQVLTEHIRVGTWYVS